MKGGAALVPRQLWLCIVLMVAQVAFHSSFVSAQYDAWEGLKGDELPNVDLEGLIAELNRNISWFKYIGNMTLECADIAKKRETLMEAIETLHDCLKENWMKCATEHAVQTGCTNISHNVAPCGTIRLGHNSREYDGPSYCRWHVEVPDEFLINMTFEEFDMEFDGPSCPYDWMEIFDGNSTNEFPNTSHILKFGRYCGRLPPFVLIGSTHQMYVHAKTDARVGYRGFRAVFQVMERGFAWHIGPQYRRKATKGNFSTKTTKAVKFEEGFYYHMWHVYYEIGYRYNVSINFTAPDKSDASVVLYDGPDSHSKKIVNHTQDESKGDPHISHYQTTAFQFFVVLKRRFLNDSSFVEVEYKPLIEAKRTSTSCMGKFAPEVGDTIGIRLNNFNPKTIWCTWKLKVKDTERYPRLKVNDWDFLAPTVNCTYGGLMIWIGDSMSGTPIGPFCNHEPNGLFTKRNTTSKGDENIMRSLTSSGQGLFVLYYSFVGNPGKFQATFTQSRCQGLLQPCTSPNNVTALNYQNEVIIRNDGNEVDYGFYCSKAKCCIIQQFPSFQPMKPSVCNIAVRTWGPLIIATSKFVIFMVEPNKTSTGMQYSCQNRSKLSALEPGPEKQGCLGTEVYLNYTDYTNWTLGAFSVEVKKSDCGFYRPDVHPSNELYPPCAEARIPAADGRYPIRFVDPEYKFKRYFLFEIKYYNTKCPKECMNNDRLEIRDPFESYVWSAMPQLPFRWKSLPTHAFVGNWTHRLRTVRDINETKCEEATKQVHCQLQINFKQTMFNMSGEDAKDVTCPHEQGFNLVGRTCYKPVYPGNIANPSQEIEKTSMKKWLPLNLKMSSVGAEKICMDYKSHLAAFNTRAEYARLKLQFFGNWWGRYLKHVKGFKVFHIGLKDDEEAGVYRHTNGQPLTFSDWNMPEAHGWLPDRTQHPDDKSRDIHAVRSRRLRTGMKRLQPQSWNDTRCTAMVVKSPHLPTGWVKIPCNLDIPGAFALCEADPHARARNVKKKALTIVKPNENRFRNLIRYQHGRHVLVRSKYECSPDYNLIGDKCYKYIAKTSNSETMGKERALSLCTVAPGSQMAKITDEFLPILIEYLPVWRLDFDDSHMWIEYGNDTEACHKLMPEIKHKLGVENPYVTWKIKQVQICTYNTEEILRGVLCERKARRVNDACGKNQFRCSEGSCILMHHKCDGYADCIDGSDESGDTCANVCEGHNKDDLILDCAIDCFPGNCTCDALYHQCGTGGCVSMSKVCDHRPDCKDASDESNCVEKICDPLKEFACSNSTCIDKKKRCDFVRDCANGADEDGCDFSGLCPAHILKKAFQCPDGPCIPISRKGDTIPDCPGPVPADEQDFIEKKQSENPYTKKENVILHQPICMSEKVSCRTDFTKCYDRREACVYDHNIFGDLKTCRDGSHLQNCTAMECPSMFKCPRAYCIPLRKVCDGVADCPWGEEEDHCEQYSCPGLFRCKNETRCLKPGEVCDDYIHCQKSRDDEELCGLKRTGCLKGCECNGLAIRCEYQNFSKVPEAAQKIPSKVRVLILRFNKIATYEANTAFNNFKMLQRLDISHNALTQIEEKSFEKLVVLRELYVNDNEITTFRPGTFDGLGKVVILKVQNNPVHSIVSLSFRGLVSLKELDLSRMKLRTLTDGSFSGLVSLERLDLSNSDIEEIKDNAFMGIEKLVYLNLQGNSLKDVGMGPFKMIPQNVSLTVIRHKFCCYARHVRECAPRGDEFSSCDELLAHGTFRVSVWVLGLLAVMGNVVLVVQRFTMKKDTTPSILVLHLGVADFMMGVYLLVIGAADQFHKHKYMDSLDAWRSHALCKFAGWLSMVSAEMSVYLVTLITIDRIIAIVICCYPRRMTVKTARGFIALGWTFSCITSILPILDVKYFGQEGYIRNGACLLFSVTRGKGAAWEYTLAVFIIMNTVCLMTMFFGYSAVFFTIFSGAKPDFELFASLEEEVELPSESEKPSETGVSGLSETMTSTVASTTEGPSTSHGGKAIPPSRGGRGTSARGSARKPTRAAGSARASRRSRASSRRAPGPVPKVSGFPDPSTGPATISKGSLDGSSEVPTESGIDSDYGSENAPDSEDADSFYDVEPEEIYRREMVVAHRLVLIVFTNFVCWTPAVVMGIMAFLGYEISQMTSAWIALFVIPINAAMNPYLLTLFTKPYKKEVDDLIAVWRIGDQEPDDEESDNEQGDQDASNMDYSTSKSRETQQESILREIM